MRQPLFSHGRRFLPSEFVIALQLVLQQQGNVIGVASVEQEQGRTGYPCDTVYGAYEKGSSRQNQAHGKDHRGDQEQISRLWAMSAIPLVRITWWSLIDLIYHDGTKKALGCMTGRVHGVVRCSYEDRKFD